jgi:hypothetical protein
LGIPGKPELSTEYPTGIPYVIVNGKIVVDNRSHTGERPGYVLTLKE